MRTLRDGSSVEPVMEREAYRTIPVPDPAEGDVARVLECVELESGCVLPRNQNVAVTNIVPGNPYIGIKWCDDDGLHVMALHRDRLEVLL